ncbi:MAG: hypothetical protein DMG25_07905 [Acidobacteria bacterium]|nr:MAG: hypothetical protein DMG25_07905 [Acidobacteriota bacterium]PYV25496.1 MAG: hypothetical protein DMG27_09610 [Acidobacteriota bacterium]
MLWIWWLVRSRLGDVADLAQLDLKAKGGEFRLRALLEDLVEYHKGVYPTSRLALAVWFAKSPEGTDQNLLELFHGLRKDPKRLVLNERQSLLWKTGSEGPPFVNIHATSVEYFEEQLKSNPQEVAKYFERSEVLYFDKQLLNEDILQAFNVFTEPSGLIKGWYLSREVYNDVLTGRYSVMSRQQTRPEIGLVKIEESADFEYCRGPLNVEVSQRWLPLSAGALSTYTFYNDLQDGRPGYFLFQGGSLYRLLKIEVKTAPEYSARLLEKLRDDRYPEVYLRAVHPPQ